MHAKTLLMPVVVKILQIKKNNHSDISNKMDKAIKNDKAIKQMHMLLAIHSFVVNQIFWIITWNLPKNKQGAKKEG